MAAFVSRHTESFATAPQITSHDLAEIAAMGFKTVVNNRPDGEGGAEQPSNAEIEASISALLGCSAPPSPSGRLFTTVLNPMAAISARSCDVICGAVAKLSV